MVDILILNFNRPTETKLCLEAIKKFALFEHRVILFNNGGDDFEEIFNFYRDGLIDKLIFNKKNEGEGFGCVELYQNCRSKYSFFIENDCELTVPITEESISEFIRAIESGIACIDLTGGICGENVYSGRVFFIETNFYKSIKKCDENGIYGGPGPFNDVPPLEHFIQKFFKDNNYQVAHTGRIYKENGKWSVREIGDGMYKHRTDTQAFYILRKPTYKTKEYPPFDDEEWNLALSGKWIDGTIPNKWAAHSFTFWKD